MTSVSARFRDWKPAWIDDAIWAMALVASAILLAGCEEDGTSANTPALAVVYVANSGDGTISQFVLDEDSGALSETNGSPFAARSGVRNLAIHPEGKFLFSANTVHGTVSVFAVEEGTGALTRLTSHAATDTPTDVAITPDGQYLYASTYPVPDFGVVGWSVDAVTGTLTALPGWPLAVYGQHLSLAIDAEGDSLLLDCPLGDAVCAMGISIATGALAPDPPTVYSSSGGAKFVAAHPTRPLMCAVVDGPASLSCWTIVSAGILAPNGGPVLDPGAITQSLALHPTEDFGYFTSDGGISAVSLNAAGVPTLLGAGFPVTSATAPAGTAIDSTGQYLFVTDDATGQLHVFEIDPGDGGITLLDSYATGANPNGILSVTLE